MNRRDRILKYLSGSLENPEIFEEELKKDSELAEEYRKILASVKELDNLAEGEVSQDYFNSIQPVFRERQKSGKKFYLRSTLTYSFSSALGAVLLFVIINYAFLSGNSKLELYDELLEEYNSDDLMEVVDENYSYESLYSEYEADLSIETYLAEEIQEIEVLDMTPGVLSIYTNDYIESLSESEFESLIAELESKKNF